MRRRLDIAMSLVGLCRHGDYADLVVGVGAEGLVRAGFAGWCGAMCRHSCGPVTVLRPGIVLGQKETR